MLCAAASCAMIQKETVTSAAETFVDKESSLQYVCKVCMSWKKYL